MRSGPKRAPFLILDKVGLWNATIATAARAAGTIP
jgi:hypothetical protein